MANSSDAIVNHLLLILEKNASTLISSWSPGARFFKTEIKYTPSRWKASKLYSSIQNPCISLQNSGVQAYNISKSDPSPNKTSPKN